MTTAYSDAYLLKLISVRDLEELYASNEGITDVYLSTNKRPCVRILDQPTLVEGYDDMEPAHMTAIIESLSGTRDEQARKNASERMTDNFAFDTGAFRFRVNVSRTQIGKDQLICIRRIPQNIPTPEALGLPNELVALTEQTPRKSGLIIVGGPTGNGKSTTLASLLANINENNYGHIVTVEDPIEFQIRDRNCLVSQRELGSAVESWAQGAKSTLRQKADYVMIGEIQDKETAQAVLRVTESGHTVFTTLHTSSAAKMVERFLSFFGDEEQGQIRNVLANNLLLLVGQQLIPNKLGGLSLATETVPMTDAIASTIRDNKDSAAIRNALTMMGDAGDAKLMDARLAEMVHENILEINVARGYAHNLTLFDSRVASERKGVAGRGR